MGFPLSPEDAARLEEQKQKTLRELEEKARVEREKESANPQMPSEYEIPPEHQVPPQQVIEEEKLGV